MMNRCLMCWTVDDSATESEGDGNDGGSMLTVAPPTRTAKREPREPRAKGVLKRKLVASEGQSRKVMRTSSPPPDHLPPVVVVEVQQPKGAVISIQEMEKIETWQRIIQDL